MTTMRRLPTVSLIALALLAPLAACGSDTDDAASDTSPGGEVTVAEDGTADDGPVASAPAPVDTAAPGTDLAGSVTVEGAYGPIDIPAEPATHRR